MRFGSNAALLLLGVVVIVAGSLWQADWQTGQGRPLLAGRTAFVAGTSPESAPAAAAGEGFTDWWGKHGQQVAEFAACMLDGAGLARLLIAGISGVGGVLAAAALIAGALACLT
jgi:hypothetical protein